MIRICIDVLRLPPGLRLGLRLNRVFRNECLIRARVRVRVRVRLRVRLRVGVKVDVGVRVRVRFRVRRILNERSRDRTR